jgi:flagellar hook-associated protein 3 FlgL
MSGSISGITGWGILPELITNVGTVHAQLDTLTEQAGSGLIAQTYAGLGSGASVAIDLSPQVATLQTYNTNITQATGMMGVAQTALSQIQQIGSQFVSDMPNLNGLDPQEIDNIASQAQSALVQVASLLDTQDGGVYVFGGQDSSHPPVPDPNNILSSGFYKQINLAVSGLTSNGYGATAATTLAIATSNSSGTSPFSAYMSQPGSLIALPVVQTGDGMAVSIGIAASANAAVVSTGTSTTGSYMRDLLRSLATLGSLSSAQTNDPNFAPLVEDTRSSLTSSVDAMATDAGVLGNQQAQLTSVQSQLTSMSNALSGQVSSAQDVDMASTLSQLTAVQAQLQESYRLIVNAATLSLGNYLPA